MRPSRVIAVGARRPSPSDEEAEGWRGADPLLLRPEEAARALGIGRSKLFELLAASELPVVRIGRATRIPLPALRRWVEAHTLTDGAALSDGAAPSPRGSARGRDERPGPAPR